MGPKHVWQRPFFIYCDAACDFWNMVGILPLQTRTAAVVKRKKKAILPAEIQTGVKAFPVWTVIAASDLSASVV